MAVNNLHPGYAVTPDTRFYPGKTVYIPLRLSGGLASDWHDDKGRHLNGCIVTDYPCGQGELFDDENSNIVVFDNEPHAHNFLNKWVGDGVGYQEAWAAWEKHLAVKQEAKRWGRDVAPLVDRLQAERDRYLTISNAFDAASEIVKLINDGAFNEDNALTVFKLVIGQSAHPEVRQLYSDLIKELGLE